MDAGNTDIFLIKLDSGGNISWQKTYDINEKDRLRSITQTMDGGCMIAGYTCSGPVGDVDCSALLLKIDNNGAISWQKTYGESVADYANSVQRTTDGDYIVAGTYQIPVEEGIWVFKVNIDGGVLWQRGFSDRIVGKVIHQTIDGGYIVLGATTYVSNKIIVTKLDANGDRSWSNTYSTMFIPFSETDVYPSSIQQYTDGSYIFTYHCYFGTGIVKLDSNGNFSWEKHHPTISNLDSKFSSIRSTSDGGTIVVGYTEYSGFGGRDALVVKLDAAGNVTWQKTYGSSGDDYAYSIEQTTDGGYIIGGSTRSFVENGVYGWVLNVDGSGSIPGCDIISSSNIALSDSPYGWGHMSCCGPSDVNPATIVDTNAIPQDYSATMNAICLSDSDDDGIPYDEDNCPDVFNPDQTDTDGDCIGDVCDEFPAIYDPSQSDTDSDGIGDACDTCPLHPNSPLLGICFQGMWGKTCLSDEECSTGTLGRCSMAQTDNIHCDCKSNFDCDYDVDGSDAARFKADFGRSLFNNPCISQNPCDGDFECDGDVDGTDASDFKRYFGITPFSGYCLACVDGVYQYDCSY